LSELEIDGVIVFYYYDDVTEAAKFYREVMGFKLVMTREEWVRIFMVKPNFYLGLVKGDRGYHKASPTKPVMLTLDVPGNDNVETWFEHLKKLGVRTIDEAPRIRENGGKVFLLEDPEGYVIEIISRALHNNASH
jgi:catechol 2,3-dioxygenase-like lactoylglutathione lyase family enzyme